MSHMQCCQTVQFFGHCPIFEGSSENRSEKGNVRKAAKMSEIITFLCRSPVLSLFSATEGTNHCTFACKKASAWLWKCKVTVTCLDQAGWHVDLHGHSDSLYRVSVRPHSSLQNS